MRAARAVMWVSALAGMFLAFGWPLAVSPDPASPVFHGLAVATLVAFLASLAAILAMKR